MSEPRLPVVIAAPPMRTGGTEQHLLYILPELARRGFDITAVLLAGGGALENQLRDMDVRVVAPQREFKRPLRTIAQAFLIRSAIRSSSARVLHAFLSEPFIAAYAACQMLPGQRPALIHGRRSLSFYAVHHPLAQRFERMALNSADRLVGNSTAVARELIAESGRPDRVAVIHNGIPLRGAVQKDERDRARRLFAIGENELVLSMVANFFPYKGHIDLIEALALALPQIGRPVRVLLAGRDAGVRDELQRRIDRLGLAEQIDFIGEWPGSREPFAAADIGLLVSHTEGFSNSLIEGMASGLPMIATAVGGNLDAIDDGNTGILVPVSSPARLAEVIVRLASDAKLRRRIGKAALEKAESAFSLKACVDAYEKLWRELAK